MITESEILEEAKYYVTHHTTFREMASVFGRSKSAIGYDLCYSLFKCDKRLHNEVSKICLIRREEGRVKGGRNSHR